MGLDQKAERQGQRKYREMPVDTGQKSEEGNKAEKVFAQIPKKLPIQMRDFHDKQRVESPSERISRSLENRRIAGLTPTYLKFFSSVLLLRTPKV